MLPALLLYCPLVAPAAPAVPAAAAPARHAATPLHIMKRYLLPLCLLLAPLLVACSSGGQDEGRRPTIPLEACRLTGGVSAQCGELLVYDCLLYTSRCV